MVVRARPPVFKFRHHKCNKNIGEIQMYVTIELRAAEGGDDSKLLIADMATIYAKACKRRCL